VIRDYLPVLISINENDTAKIHTGSPQRVMQQSGPNVRVDDFLMSKNPQGFIGLTSLPALFGSLNIMHSTMSRFVAAKDPAVRIPDVPNSTRVWNRFRQPRLK
jgi:hypothetical protein